MPYILKQFEIRIVEIFIIPIQDLESQLSTTNFPKRVWNWCL